MLNEYISNIKEPDFLFEEIPEAKYFNLLGIKKKLFLNFCKML